MTELMTDGHDTDIITESPEFRKIVERSQDLIKLLGTISTLHTEGRMSDAKAVELANPFEPTKYKKN